MSDDLTDDQRQAGVRDIIFAALMMRAGGTARFSRQELAAVVSTAEHKFAWERTEDGGLEVTIIGRMN